MSTTTVEGTFTVTDGTKLYTKTWKPEAGAAKAALVFLHGYADHIGTYYDLFPTLAAASIAVYGFDQRGWGQSVTTPAQRGLTGPTALVLSDINDYMKHVSSLPENKGKPLFLMGHSMGGGEALCYMISTSPKLSDRPRVAGLLLEAPFVDLDPSERPSWLMLFAGKVLGYALPSMQLPQKPISKWVCRSEQVMEDIRADDLCRYTGTLQGSAGIFQRSGELVKLGNGHQVAGLTTALPCPLWHSHGDMDMLASHDAAKKVFDVLQAPAGDKTFKTYPGAYHKLHAEPDGLDVQYAKDTRDWILAHCGTGQGGVQVGTASK